MSAPHPKMRAAVDASVADWVLHAAKAGDAADALRYGPSGFEAYLRLPVDPNAPSDGSPGAVVHPTEAALRVLEAHTTTPGVAYVGVWHGYGFANGPDPVAPTVPFPNAWMYLFTGPVSAMRYAQRVVWSYPDGTPDAGIDAEPDLVWPADYAWCLAWRSTKRSSSASGARTRQQQRSNRLCRDGRVA